MSAAAYALYRRSTSQQDLSIEEQRQAVRAWAEEHDFRIVREFADDASGLDTARRRDFLALLDLAGQPAARQADVVLCYDVSRFSRLDPDEAAFHEYSLRRAGVRIIYTHDPGANDSGLAGHLVKSLKRVLAHEYSQKLSQVVRRGKRAHASLGHWTGGRPPFGYRRALAGPDGAPVPLSPGRWKARGERVVLIVEPLEAAIVKTDIFEAYVSKGLGVRAIAQCLNARGVPPPTADRRLGRAAWSKGSVWAILRNPVYRGALIHGKARYRDLGKKRGKQAQPASERVVVEGALPAIVPDDLWQAAQARHGVRRFGVGRPWHRPYLLSGLIECAGCGKRYHAQRQERGRIPAYYLCGGYVASGAGFCSAPRIPTTYLEDAVLDGIEKRLERVLDLDELRRRLQEMLAAEPADRAPSVHVADRLTSTEQKIARLVGVLAAGTEPLPSVRTALVGLEQERARLAQQLREASERAAHRGPAPESAVMALLDSLGNVREILSEGGPEERKAVVRTFVHGIRIDAVKRQAVLRWYRLPRVDSFVKLVAVGGIEPPTRGL
jgi:site-specific DNA recombinase